MSSTQQMLAAITGMQENAQAALPVIPNNGNPAGANNMPHTQEIAGPAPVGPDLSWLQPSPAMQHFNTMLQQRQAVLDAQARQPQAAPVAPAPQSYSPVLPQQRTAAPALSGGPVMPMAGPPTVGV